VGRLYINTSYYSTCAVIKHLQKVGIYDQLLLVVRGFTVDGVDIS